MKKHARFLLIALVVVAVLSAAIYALAAPSSEADEDIALQTVTFQEEEIPATESLAVLTDNPQFAQHGFQVRPVSDAAAPLSTAPMIDRDTAIETAVLAAQARGRCGVRERGAGGLYRHGDAGSAGKRRIHDERSCVDRDVFGRDHRARRSGRSTG